MTSGIYKLDFGKNNIYIGKSNNVTRRYDEHLESFSKGKASVLLQQAYNKWGRPSMEILCRCHTDHIDLMETCYIYLLNPNLNFAKTVEVPNDDREYLLVNTHKLGDSTVQMMQELDDLRDENVELNELMKASQLYNKYKKEQEYSKYWRDKYLEEKGKGWFTRIFG